MHDFTGSTTEPIKEIMREIVDMGEKNKKNGGEGFQDMVGLLFRSNVSVKSFSQFLPLIIKHLFSSSPLFFDFGSSFSN